jgi:hypothetical protein
MNPVRTVADAFAKPFKFLYVVGLCCLINVVTSPGHWWVQWVALGMGIAVIAAWARAVKLLVAAGAVAALGAWAYRRWGDAGKAQVERFFAQR